MVKYLKNSDFFADLLKRGMFSRVIEKCEISEGVFKNKKVDAFADIVQKIILIRFFKRENAAFFVLIMKFFRH